MITTILTAILAVMGAGLIAKRLVQDSWYHEITIKEFCIAVIASLVIGIPAGFGVVYNMARNSEATFVEFWNGREVRAVERPVACRRDGVCRWEYDCDPYLVTYSCNCTKDGCSTCTRTEYHSCPYVNTEYNYYIETTLGNYTIDNNRFPYDWANQRWRARTSIPTHVANRAGVGPPQFWLDALQRLNAGDPWAVTQRREYTNYVLAARSTTIMQRDAETYVQQYKELLPDFDADIYNFYQADKVYGIGPWNRSAWSDVVARFNASFSFFQGDLHLTLVDADKHTIDPDAYASALKTYWMRADLGDRPLAKNTFVVILGVRQDTIEWARAFTGMPVGNDAAVIAVRDDLPGQEFTVANLFGDIDLTASKPDYGDGVLATILATSQATKFRRVYMSDFEYLFKEIPVPWGWRVLAGLVSALLSIPLWILMAKVGDPPKSRERYGYWPR